MCETNYFSTDQSGESAHCAADSTNIPQSISSEPKPIPCPFVYANGKPCNGTVVRADGYGPNRKDPDTDEWYQDVRRIRLWCSHKWDHCGAISGWAEAQRMLFYPNELSNEVLRAVREEFGV